MTLVLGTPTALLGMLAQLEAQGAPQTAVRTQVIDVQGLAEMVPLSRVRYVDGNTTVPAALRNGSIAYPFSTLLAAVTNLAGAGGVILVAPGSYTEPAVAVPANTPLSIVGIGPRSQATFVNATFSNSVSSTSDLAAFNVSFTNAFTSTQRLFVDNCIITNCSAGGSQSRFQDSTIANLTNTTDLFMRDCTVQNPATLAIAELWNCQFAAATVSQSLTARLCTFSGAVSCNNVANLWKTRFASTLAVTGALTSDYDSIAGIVAGLTFGSFVLNGPQAAKASVAVTVPAIAAGDVDYADVSLVGTDLEGLVPAGSLLVANPTDDLELSGPGGGFINVRASAANTARFAFLGPLPGGVVPFLLGVI